MSRLGKTFAGLKEENRKALIIYMTACDPDLDTAVAAAKACIDGGADILEVGVPFSDPLADGPVIQRGDVREAREGGRRGRARVCSHLGCVPPVRVRWSSLHLGCPEVEEAHGGGSVRERAGAGYTSCALIG